MKKIILGRVLLVISILGPFISFLLSNVAAASDPYYGISMGPVFRQPPALTQTLDRISGLVLLIGIVSFVVGFLLTRKGTSIDRIFKITGAIVYLLPLVAFLYLISGSGGVHVTSVPVVLIK